MRIFAKSRKFYTALLISIFLGANLIVGVTVYAGKSTPDEEKVALEKLGIMMRVLRLIRQDYVNKEDVQYKELLYHAMQGMVSQLDPHSSFLEPDSYQKMQESTEGEFAGIGIYVTKREGTLTVIAPIEGTPGSRAGLTAGDKIISINDQATQDMTLNEAIDLMKGDPGTDVTLEIYRPETEETKTFNISRAVIEVPSVKDAKILKEDIGYLRIVQFDQHTAEMLWKTLGNLKDRGMQSVIIDLRNNPGGLLQAAVDVSGFFLKDKKLVVSTQGRRESQHKEYRTNSSDKYMQIPVVILVNSGSASASEIVAGCLQDHDQALLVGEKTFGKGTVQSVIPLPDKSALRLTTAKYYTPSHRVIHNKGITPDIERKIKKEKWQALMSDYSSVQEDKKIDIERDPQLRRAVKVLQGYDVFASTQENEER